MIGLTYAMGYVQMYLLSNFDEGYHVGKRGLLYAVLCSLFYTGISFLCKWFDQSRAVSVGFFFYMLLIYGCAFLVYRSKREIDERLLNDELRAFQERGKGEEHEKRN